MNISVPVMFQSSRKEEMKTGFILKDFRVFWWPHGQVNIPGQGVCDKSSGWSFKVQNPGELNRRESSHPVVRELVRGGKAIGNGTNKLRILNGKLIRQIRWESGGLEKPTGRDSLWVWVRSP